MVGNVVVVDAVHYNVIVTVEVVVAVMVDAIVVVVELVAMSWL